MRRLSSLCGLSYRMSWLTVRAHTAVIRVLMTMLIRTPSPPTAGWSPEASDEAGPGNNKQGGASRAQAQAHAPEGGGGCRLCGRHGAATDQFGRLEGGGRERPLRLISWRMPLTPSCSLLSPD